MLLVRGAGGDCIPTAGDSRTFGRRIGGCGAASVKCLCSKFAISTSKSISGKG